jgi:thiol-disulfide isomerase/thioredoxin
MNPVLLTLALAGEVDASRVHALILERKGRPVVVQLWATWCAPCVEEFPLYVALQRDRKDVSVVSISIDDTADHELVNELVARHDPPFPVYIKAAVPDAQFIDGIDEEWSGVVPATLVFDREGRRVALIKGEHDRRDIDRVLAVIARMQKTGSEQTNPHFHSGAASAGSGRAPRPSSKSSTLSARGASMRAAARRSRR